MARQQRIDERPDRRTPQQNRWRGGAQDLGGHCVVDPSARCGLDGLAATGKNAPATAVGRRPAGPQRIVIAADAAGAAKCTRDPSPATLVAITIPIRATGATTENPTASATCAASHRIEQAGTGRTINNRAGSGASAPPRS